MEVHEEATDTALRALVSLNHPNPHALLGPHPVGEDVVVRALLPGAKNVTLVPERGERVPMQHRVEGVFEGRIGPRPEGALPRYRIQWEDADGRARAMVDPYRHGPTLGPFDLHLIGEGRHERLWEKLGARAVTHEDVEGVAFAVWAPNTLSVSVVGDFNGWDGRRHPMRRLNDAGVWELFVPGLAPGALYQFEVHAQGSGPPMMKADPLARQTEAPPAQASVVEATDTHVWGDSAWMERRAARDLHRSPMAIYELHLGSWRRLVEEGDRPLTYDELAPVLSAYVKKLGFTHVEFLPLAEHPYGPSWGYQVGAYYAPSARFGPPEALRRLIDHLHQQEIGVLVDWVPAHFPRDTHLLGRFDGTPLYEHPDPRRGSQPDWGTLVFDYGRLEVQNFLIANALYWLESFHVDGLRVDAVASMLYRDYSRPEGQWEPNVHGGRENLEAVDFLKRLNETVHRLHPGALVIAEESTSWPQVTGALEHGGLGFDYKWNMGWMNDTLAYFQTDPIYRQHRHGALTFGLMYAWSEQFILPLSHDEVVHLKASLLEKMPGDPWRKRANLRALFGWMWAHPGKKLLFMGGEFGQRAEWSSEKSLDWHLLDLPGHLGIQTLVAAINQLYREHPALWAQDGTPQGFQWLQVDRAQENVLAFVREDGDGQTVACIANLSPVPREGWVLGLPREGLWAELLNTDAPEFGGSGMGNPDGVVATLAPADQQPASAVLTLPPLSVLWFLGPEQAAPSLAEDTPPSPEPAPAGAAPEIDGRPSGAHQARSSA